MSRKRYVTPFLLAYSGGIDLTPSQEGDWGTGGDTDYSDFWAWWNSPDVQANADLLYEAGFDPYDPLTWEKFGFDPKNPATWDELFNQV